MVSPGKSTMHGHEGAPSPATDCADGLSDLLADNRESRLAILRLRAAYYGAQRDVGLVAGDISLMDMIMLGHLEGRPVDMSSLSNMLKMPRPTVRRHVERLEKAGWLTRRRDGRHSYVYLTERALKSMGKHLDEIDARIAQNYHVAHKSP